MSHPRPVPPVRTLRARRPARLLRRATPALLLAALAAVTPTAHAQVSPAESASKLKPAPGLKASLWASEPMVVNPTTIDIDSRGRVWVTEGLNYRLTRGGNKRFERIADADKIKILSDTDGDGQADKVTVFADKIFPVPMGIAVEEHWSRDGTYQGCKVFVGNSPDLLVLEDTDGDDVADKRYPLLTGFGGIDSDHGVHGMVLGLDGKLYFTHGDGCCSVQPDKSERGQNFDVVDRSGRHVKSDQLANTLRVNRDGTQFEVVADRQRNNYETTQNSFGNGFTSDNDDDGNRGSRVIWVMDGGNYGYRTPGSPRHWGEDVPGIVPKLVGTGNGSPCGVAVYEGGLLPSKYFGAVLEAEAGPRVIFAHPITRQGAAFRTAPEVMLASDDPWFRPVDVTAAPDGSLLVADWYDAGVGGHAFSDQTTGRIYRVVPEGKGAASIAKPDFASVAGLMAALESANVSARDVARRLLSARIDAGERDAVAAVAALASDAGAQPELRARAIWTLAGSRDGASRISPFLKDRDARIRELAVRVLGRDVSRVGQVETKDPIPAPAAAAHLDQLLPLAKDVDAGVRRELILALRFLPTAQVGEALRTLTAGWDGQDRWYLEALSLAVRNRESDYLAKLFDGHLFGDLGLPAAGEALVALPPYFPVDRNEAFLSASDEPLPASALSKTLGLAWALHRVEALPLVVSLMPSLKTPELQQAADDVITHVQDAGGARILADLILATPDPIRRRQTLANLARKLDGPWRGASNDDQVTAATEVALNSPELRLEGLRLVNATGNTQFADAVAQAVDDDKAKPEVRVEALTALARLKDARAAAAADRLIARAREARASDQVSEAAVRALPRLGEARDRLATLFADDTLPLGLRREALRSYVGLNDGGKLLAALASEGKLPEALRTEAATTLRAHPDYSVRQKAQQLFPIKTASGQPLPPVGDLVRRDGDAARGREVFFRAPGAQANAGALACGACHRVQGQGNWVGPDLSTIGAKGSREELLRSILNPSAAIGYNYRAVTVATNDGRTITGLVVEDSPDRLVLKDAEGRRVTLRPSEVDERTISEVSLMPEGLAESMSEQDLVDLLAFLGTLKQPVSIVGLAQVVGPVAEAEGQPALRPLATIDTGKPVRTAGGKDLAWRRASADAEGRIDLTALAGDKAGEAVYVLVPLSSPIEQSARLVLDTGAKVQAWLDGKPVNLTGADAGKPGNATLSLPAGTAQLLLRVTTGPEAGLVTTLVSDRPVEFSAAPAGR